MCPVLFCALYLDSTLFKLIHARFSGAYVCVCRYLAIANRLFPGKVWSHPQTYWTRETPKWASRFLYIGQNVSWIFLLVLIVFVVYLSAIDIAISLEAFYHFKFQDLAWNTFHALFPIFSKFYNSEADVYRDMSYLICAGRVQFFELFVSS